MRIADGLVAAALLAVCLAPVAWQPAPPARLAADEPAELAARGLAQNALARLAGDPRVEELARAEDLLDSEIAGEIGADALAAPIRAYHIQVVARVHRDAPPGADRLECEAFFVAAEGEAERSVRTVAVLARDTVSAEAK